MGPGRHPPMAALDCLPAAAQGDAADELLSRDRLTLLIDMLLDQQSRARTATRRLSVRTSRWAGSVSSFAPQTVAPRSIGDCAGDRGCPACVSRSRRIPDARGG